MAFLKPIFSSGSRQLSDLVLAHCPLAWLISRSVCCSEPKKIFLGFSGCSSVFPVPSSTTFDRHQQQLKRILNEGASPKLSEIQTGSEERQRK